MADKIGRNEPCICGSGKKYKHCCGKPSAPAQPPDDSHEGAVERAIAWLSLHHRKAFASALEEEIEATVEGCFDDQADDEEIDEAMADLAPELWDQLRLNLTEWLLAEGEIQVKGDYQRVSALLLGPRGPLMTSGQRAWLTQLAQRPLRLYDVTRVVAGSGLTLCDALDATLAPIDVTERAGSRTLRPGMQIGARVMAVAGGHQLSGAVYPFSMFAGRQLQQSLQPLQPLQPMAQDDDAGPSLLGYTLIEHWLAQYLRPPTLPDFVYSSTGEPLLFTTDHYEVLDADALATALAAQPDVQGSADAGWNRLVDGDDGQTRPLATLVPERGGRRLALQTQTAGLAERARPWFEALAGAAVKHVLREVSDPKGLLSNRPPQDKVAASTSLPEGLDPKELAQAMAEVIQRSYAHWADEPIRVLSDQTPRQAMQTAAGLERVKGLLRSYEDGEARMAAQQGREVISYQFLWDDLGLVRG